MASAVNTPGDVDRPDPHVGPTSNEQPNAPYLEAVGAYAFRAPARYHVPGHKGGPGAAPALGKAIGTARLAAEGPQDITGSTSARRRRRTSAPRGWRRRR